MSLLAEPAAADGNTAASSTSAPAVAAAIAPQTASPSASAAATPIAAASGIDKPWFTELMNDKGDINPAAWDKLPEGLKGYKDTFAQNKNINGLMMQMANLASLAGKKGLAPLPDGASDEMKAARAELMRQINGVPAKPEEYGVKRPDDYPEQHWDDDYVKGQLAIMHKYHAPPGMAKELADFDVKYNLNRLKEFEASSEAEQKAAREKVIGKLKAEWKTPEVYQKNVDLARRAVQTAGLDPNDPIFATEAGIKLAAFFGSRTSEDKLVSGSSTVNTGLNDYAKANDIIANPENQLHKAYHDSTHPLHEQAVQNVNTFMAAHAKRRKG